ncbi:hypothetical protein BSE24067_03888 [Burkholderia seminalis]|nr:hypothetical protein BSE24067_03888 [Burkholderia seminalis]
MLAHLPRAPQGRAALPSRMGAPVRTAELHTRRKA